MNHESVPNAVIALLIISLIVSQGVCFHVVVTKLNALQQQVQELATAGVVGERDE